MQRREFLAGSVGVALSAFPRYARASETKKYATDRIKLGPMGVEVSRLAMGTGTNGVAGSSNQSRKLGLRGLADLLRAGYDSGITFWDSADQYGTHVHVREALKGLPREKITLLTKTHASTANEMRADLDRFRRELGTDYLDIVLLHCMTDADWPVQKRGAMEVLAEAREKKIVRTHGVSCHTIEALRSAAAEPWVQVDLARINPAGAIMDADLNTVLGVLRQMKAAGKGVIGMKILGAGRLRDRAEESLRFVLAQNCVDAFTIGGEDRSELQDLLRKIPASSVRG